MRRLLAVLAVAAGLAAPAASASGGWAFGRTNGNIVPFTVTIVPGGGVRATGPVTVGRATLTKAQLGVLAATAKKAGFASLPATTLCPGALPDVAAMWIRSGSRRVLVHGTCSAGFTRLWNALARAVSLSYG